MKLTHDEAVQVCYLRTAEFVKAAAAEDGIDADAVAKDMSDEELAAVLDEVVEALASEGAFDDVLDSVEEEAPVAEEAAEETTETAEASGGIVEKTAALLEKFAAAAPPPPVAKKNGLAALMAAKKGKDAKVKC